jgi:hypothetical protein
MYQARSIVASCKKWTGEHDAEMAALNDTVRRESHEGWHDGLGFCKFVLYRLAATGTNNLWKARGTLLASV